MHKKHTNPTIQLVLRQMMRIASRNNRLYKKNWVEVIENNHEVTHHRNRANVAGRRMTNHGDAVAAAAADSGSVADVANDDAVDGVAADAAPCPFSIPYPLFRNCLQNRRWMERIVMGI